MNTQRHRTIRHARHGAIGRSAFTLIEAVSALAITAMAASVVLLAMETSLETTADSVDQTIAQGLADQILDEILGLRYAANEASVYQYPMGPSSSEANGNGRELFNDIDDVHGFRQRPAKDRFGIALGQGNGAGGQRHSALRVTDDRFNQWRVAIDVHYVAANDLSTPLADAATSDYRAIQVRIQHIDADGTKRELARSRRIVAYIAPPS